MSELTALWNPVRAVTNSAPGGVELVLRLVFFVSCTSLSFAQDDVVLTEFMADNRTVLRDRDGDRSDWIEIYNRSFASVDLDGWELTDRADSPAMWTFPAVELGPREFLIVFASGKDRRDPDSELHTNFKLDENGEFLGLSRPNGAFTTFFVPEYPTQSPDSSYGPTKSRIVETLIGEGDTADFLVPESGDLEFTWTETQFDDASWQSGALGIGFDAKQEPTFGGLIRTDVGDVLLNVNASMFLRIPFTIPLRQGKRFVRLRVKYDDGFIAWINGQEIARANAFISTPRFDSRARVGRDDRDATKFQDFLLTLPAELFQAGENILAIQAMNDFSTGDDLLILPIMEEIIVESVDTESGEYYDVPTPRFPSLDGFSAVTPVPSILPQSGAYVDSLNVEIQGAISMGEVRYTLDGVNPSRNSELYTEPIQIEAGLRIRARAFQDGFLPSRTIEESYVILDEELIAFDSNLPLMVCTTFESPMGQNCGGGAYTPGRFLVFAPGEDGRTRLTDDLHFDDRVGFRRRGSSTCGRPKPSFNVEVRDERDEDKNVEILDFPRESDYIMYGPYNFDRAFMRNPLAYWMSRQAGRWAARTRFVECFFHSQGGRVDMSHYHGVYVFMEKNKRSPDRVDLEQLGPNDDEEPIVTGGYLLKRDRVGAGEVSTFAGGYSSLVFVYPKQPSTAQRTFIQGYIDDAIASLTPEIGRQEDTDLIDVGHWIDHHIVNMYTKNVDAFRLSGYFHKTRDGPLAMGPVWDFDRTMGCADDGRAANPTGFDSDGEGTLFFQPGNLGSWYSHLFENAPPLGPSPWATAYRQRWRELRLGPLAIEVVLAQLDAWADELREAAARNFDRWPQVSPRFGGFQGEVDHLKSWLVTRGEWFDDQFIDTPTIRPPGGLVTAGIEVGLSVPEGQIYYTLNGPDPRGGDDLPAPEAISHDGEPLIISEPTRLRARTLAASGAWSEPAEELYFFEFLPLVITEIMYSPANLDNDTFTPTRYAYLELQNIGSETIDLIGTRLIYTRRNSVLFDFASMEDPRLSPGEFLVVVDREEAFRERYADAGIRVAGELSRSLSSSRFEVSLVGAFDEVLLDFTYDDDWYPTTDGGGPSLVIRDPTAPRDSWRLPESWRPSVEPLGSPGRVDASPSGLQRSGDLSQDSRLDIRDGIAILLFLVGGNSTLPCATGEANSALADVNGDTNFDLSDAIYLLNYVFGRSQAPVLGTDCLPMVGCPDLCVP